MPTPKWTLTAGGKKDPTGNTVGVYTKADLDRRVAEAKKLGVKVAVKKI